MSKFSIVLIALCLSISAAIFNWRSQHENTQHFSVDQTAYRSPSQTVILLELSETLLGSKPNILSEDFLSALNVTSGLIDAFISGGRPEDRIWIACFSDLELNEKSVLGPFNTKSEKLKSLRELFSITPESKGYEREKKIQKLITAGFYPRTDARSDGYQALSIASQILSATPSFGMSENKIALITSGLFTCQRSFREDYAEFCQVEKLASCRISHCEALSSKRAYDANQLAYRELIEVVAPKLSSLGIAVNSYLVGERVLPHSLLFPSPDKKNKRCMTANEIEEHNYPNVLFRRFTIPLKDPNEFDFQETFVQHRMNTFYLAPNIHLSHFSKLTSGRFFPVRGPCPLVKYFGYRDISKDTNWGGIDDICVWNQTSSSFINQPSALSPAQWRNGFPYIVHSQELVESGVTDTEGRLLCEPGRLSISEWAKFGFLDYLNRAKK